MNNGIYIHLPLLHVLVKYDFISDAKNISIYVLFLIPISSLLAL
jgi:hypothetical protein